MWCDMFFITPLAAYIVGGTHLRYISILSGVIWVLSLLAWAFVTIKFFRTVSIPEAHAHDGKITPAGQVHFWYAVIATYLVVMFYCAHPPMASLRIVSWLLTPFFFLGVVKFDRKWEWRWKQNPVAWIATFGVPVVIWSVVLYRSLH